MKPERLYYARAMHGDMRKLKREVILSWKFAAGVLGMALMLGACAAVPGIFGG